MPPMLNCTVMCWFKDDAGVDKFLSYDKTLFTTDTDRVARQIAEVNNGLCKIFHSEEKIAEYDMRENS